MHIFRFSRMVVVVVVTVTFSHLSPVFLSILNSQFSTFFLSHSLSLSFNLFVRKRARNKKRTTSARSAFSPAGRVSGDYDYDYVVVVVVDDVANKNVDILVMSLS